MPPSANAGRPARPRPRPSRRPCRSRPRCRSGSGHGDDDADAVHLADVARKVGAGCSSPSRAARSSCRGRRARRRRGTSERARSPRPPRRRARPDLRHLMSTNFSAPRSAPRPASVTTMSASRRPPRPPSPSCTAAMLANGPPCTKAGAPRWSARGSGERRRAAARPSRRRPPARRDRRRAARVADHDVADPLLEVAPRLGEAEDRHQLRGHDDVEPSSRGSRWRGHRARR